MFTKRLWLLTIFVVVGVVAASCAPPTSMPTADSMGAPQMENPTATPVPPTDTPEPTATPVPPTATTEPPTPTTMPDMSMDEHGTEDDGMMWEADGMVAEGEYADQVEIAGVTFAWTTDDEFLYGAMWAETEGWVAVAFDPTNRMQGANYIFGYVMDGEVAIADMFGTKPAGPDSHPPDTTLGGTDDIVAFGGSEKDGVTLIEFQIPLDSGDANDKVLSPGEHVVIAAYGPTDDFGTIHTSRGYGEIMLPEHGMSMDDGDGMMGDTMWEADGMVAEGEYADQVEIAGVTFAWTTDDEFLYGAMWAETEGWVAVAFDPTNRMQGANYVFGYVMDGEVAIADMFGTKPAGPDSHPPDTTLGGTDDIVAFGGSEKDGVTLIEFQIPLDSGDANDKVLSPGTHVVIAAYGPTDDFGTIHTSRGYGEIMVK